MGHRVNVMMDDEVWAQLREIPQGERSRMVNEALGHWLKMRRRMAAAQEMDELRQRIPSAGRGEIVDWVRQEREHHE